MVRLYALASVVIPVIGMFFSYEAHRYAYMNAAVGLSIMFVLASFGHKRY